MLEENMEYTGTSGAGSCMTLRLLFLGEVGAKHGDGETQGDRSQKRESPSPVKNLLG